MHSQRRWVNVQVPKSEVSALKQVKKAVHFVAMSIVNTSQKLSGMYALRERRQHVTQEDFEFAVAKVKYTAAFHLRHSFSDSCAGAQEEPGRKHIRQQALLMIPLYHDLDFIFVFS